MLLDRIDTLIAFLTVLVLLSCVVTALAQATQAILRLRGRNLQRGLETLLCRAMVATQTPGKGKPVGLMVVHGVGRQKPGATVRTVLQGLMRAYPDARFDTDGDVAVMTLNGRQVRLYEVYWAPVLSGRRIRGSFRVDRLQQLVWFPRLNQEHREDHQRYYPKSLVRWWTRVLYPAGMIVTAINLLLMIAVQYPTNIVRRTKQRRSGLKARATPAIGRDAPASPVDDVLADWIGDVFNYLDALVGASAHVPGAHEEINGLFCRTLARVAEECSEVQILAHSMGSLVTYDALSRYKDRARRHLADDPQSAADRRPPLTRLYTIGSPLEKILFFWPKAIDRDRGWQTVEWNNFRNPLDPISGLLQSPVLGAPANHTVTGAGGLLTAHTGYRRHPTFLRVIGPRLTGAPTALSPGRLSRTLRQVLDYGESVVVYAAMLGLAGVGAWLIYRLGKSIRSFMDVPRLSLSAFSDLDFGDLFLTLFPYLLGTILVILLIVFAPLFARRASEEVHQAHWR